MFDLNIFYLNLQTKNMCIFIRRCLFLLNLNNIIMDKISLLSLDMIQKEDLVSYVGGQSAAKVCGCVCGGATKPGQPDTDDSGSSDSDSDLDSDSDCADCGAANAHRVLN